MKKKSSMLKLIYEINGQKTIFGRDNLVFKTINLSKKQKFKNICRDFNLKKPIKKISLVLTILEIYK